MANAASVVSGAPGPPRSLSPVPSRSHVVSPPSPLSMTPSTPGFMRPPLFQRLGQPVIAETLQDSSGQAHASWAYLSDTKMLELAEQLLRGLVAPELLRELDRRELVALLAAHQKANTHTQDFSGVAARYPSPTTMTARGSQSPPPPVLQSTPIRVRSMQQSASVVEVARTGSAALDATTTALMRARPGCPSLPSSVRLPSARRETANASCTTVAMRVPVLQRQRMVSSRSSARFGGVVGARGVAIACSGRSPSPILQRAVSSTAVAFDGAAKAAERSPSPTPQTMANLSSARVGEVQVERTFSVTPARRSPSRGGRRGQIRRETGATEASEVTLGNGLATSRSGCETGVANRVNSSRPRSALNRRGARTPFAPESLEMAVSIRSSAAKHQEGHTVSFEANAHAESDGQALRRALDVRSSGLCRDGTTGEHTSRSTSPIARLEARSSGIDSAAGSSSVPIPFSSARRRLDTVLAEKLAAADRELSLAQGAASRFAIANPKIAQAPLNSSCSSEFSLATEETSLGRRSEEYDAKLAAKMREIEVLQKQTEDNISRLAYSKHPSMASSKRPSREASLSPPQELSRCDVHEKALSFKFSSRSHEPLDKSASNLVSNLDGCTGSTDVIRLSSGKYAAEGPHHASADAAKEVIGSEMIDGSPPNLSHSEDILEKATPADSKETSDRIIAGDSVLL